MLYRTGRTAPQQSVSDQQALLNPETSILIEKRHSHTRILKSETSGDSKNAFLHCGDVVGVSNR